MSGDNQQPPPISDLKSLPKFMRNPSPQVRFHSAFPPLTTERRVRSVMERAGFDVYKPPAKPSTSHSANSSLKAHSPRNFTAPTMAFAGRATHSDPQLNNKQRSVSNTSLSIDRKLNRLNNNSDSSYNNFSSPNLSNMNRNYSSNSVNSSDSQQPLTMMKKSARPIPDQQQPLNNTVNSNGKSYGNLSQQQQQPYPASLNSQTESFNLHSNNGSLGSELNKHNPRESTDFQFHSDIPPSALNTNNITFNYSPEQKVERELPGDEQDELYGMNGIDPNLKEENPMAEGDLPLPVEEEDQDVVDSQLLRASDNNSNSNVLSVGVITSQRQSTASAYSDFMDANESINSFDAKFEKDIAHSNDASDAYNTPPSDIANQEKFMDSNVKSPEEIFNEQTQEIDDSLQQLLSMKKELSPNPGQMNNYNGYHFPAPQINIIKSDGDSDFMRDSISSSVYNSPSQNVTRMSTMHTDDYKIYNAPNVFDNSTPNNAGFHMKTNSSANMTTIHEEVTEIEPQDDDVMSNNDDRASDVNSSILLEGLTKMRLNPLQSTQDSLKHQRKVSAESKRLSVGSFAATSNADVASAIAMGTAAAASASSSTSIASKGANLEPLEIQPPSEPITNESSSTKRHSKTPSSAPKYDPGQGPCRKCSLPIQKTQKSIWSKDSQLSGQWHRKCFTCHKCDKAFSKGESCYVFEDEPFCSEHFHELNGSLCNVCGKGVEGECLENEVEEIFHKECLQCHECGALVQADYYLYKGTVLCEKDASYHIQGNNRDIDDKLTRRRTRIMYL